MEVQISKMTIEDVLSLEPHFSENFTEFWSIHTLKNDFQNEHSYYIVAKEKNDIVGFAGAIKIIDEIEIMNIATRIDKRHLGIGSLLLSYLIKATKTLDCHTITLEVNEHNIPAINLYEKYGFERIGFRKKYYNNIDSAILMEKKII